MQLMIISGGFDLSVGMVAAGAGCAAAFVNLSHGVLVGIVVGLACGLVAGLANGVLIAKIGINPFVATFGTQAVVTGILYAATNASRSPHCPRDGRPGADVDRWVSIIA